MDYEIDPDVLVAAQGMATIIDIALAAGLLIALAAIMVLT